MTWRFYLLVPVLLALSACAPAGPGMHRSDITGIEGGFSERTLISVDRDHLLYGQVLALRQAGQTSLTVEIGQAIDGRHYRLRMDDAYRDGAALRFDGVSRREEYCAPGFGCRGYRTGFIHLSAQDFSDAARRGLRAHLIGPDAMVEIFVPAEQFQQALRQAQLMGVLP
ncbi:hypothetical protein V8J82_03190 [Gymnodinialimonas sp. 2305UL16-5]|uniref:hypothetical protein n=1 Tax=Gymnodinialimonas mytili TaxID=3126503 RepID=UPI0030A52C78